MACHLQHHKSNLVLVTPNSLYPRLLNKLDELKNKGRKCFDTILRDVIFDCLGDRKHIPWLLCDMELISHHNSYSFSDNTLL